MSESLTVPETHSMNRITDKYVHVVPAKVPSLAYSQHSLALTIVGKFLFLTQEIKNRRVNGLKIEESRYDKINHKNREFRPSQVI